LKKEKCVFPLNFPLGAVSPGIGLFIVVIEFFANDRFLGVRSCEKEFC